VTVWKHFLKTAFFSSSSLEHLAAHSSLALALFFLAASAIILSFPTDFSASLQQALFSAAVLFLGLAAAAVTSWTASRLLGSRTAFKAFFVPTLGAFTASVTAVSLPLGVLGILVFNSLLGDPRLGALLFSIVPFYNYVVFGWACEECSGLKHSKGIAVGLLGASLVLALYLLLGVLASTQ